MRTVLPASRKVSSTTSDDAPGGSPDGGGAAMDGCGWLSMVSTYSTLCRPRSGLWSAHDIASHEPGPRERLALPSDSLSDAL